MISNRVAYLIAKKLSGEIAEMEISELNDALIINPELHNIIQVLESSWENKGLPAELEESAIERINRKLEIAEGSEITVPFQSFGKMESASRVINLFKGWVKYVAASIVIVALGFWWFSKPLSEGKGKAAIENPINEVATKPGSKTRIVLPDGSIVWLNGDSKLSYKNMFQGKVRKVQLSGEAYFDVVSNPERPFIINGASITVSVTGTKFNVRDYPGEKKSETLLISGKVTVRSNRNPEKSYSLKPNEKIIIEEEFEKAESVIKSEGDKTDNAEAFKVEILPLQLNFDHKIPVETAWLNNQLAFFNESFRDVAYKMEKWYGVEIEFANSELERFRFRGKFENESLIEALEALRFSTPFRYDIQNSKVKIYK
jgi:transmembrane sensor